MSTMLSRKAAFAGALTLGAAVAMSPADANALLVTGSSGNLAASADFSFSGNILTVVLTNTASADIQANNEVLTGVIFNLTGNPLLGKTSATVGGADTIKGGPSTPLDVGGEWAYTNSLVSPFVGKQAIYSAGYFDGNARFPGSNLSGPDSVNGAQYGITTDNDQTANDNGGLQSPLIKNAVTFLLSGVSGLSDHDISNVSFQYGTALNEPNVPGTVVPIPAALPIIGAALAGFGFVGWRQQRKPA